MPRTSTARHVRPWICSTITSGSESRPRAARRRRPSASCSHSSPSCSRPAARSSGTTSSARFCAPPASTSKNARDSNDAGAHVGARAHPRPGRPGERGARRRPRGVAHRAPDAGRSERGRVGAGVRHRRGSRWRGARRRKRRGHRLRAWRRQAARRFAAVAEVERSTDRRQFACECHRGRRLRVQAASRSGRPLVRLSRTPVPRAGARRHANQRPHLRHGSGSGRCRSARPGAAPSQGAGRTLSVSSVRNPTSWTAAVTSAAARLRAGEADKVVLAREVIARGDGVVAAAKVARSLRAAYPSCFIYLVTGADGTAFVGASPELLVRRFGTRAYAQPMAGSVARGATDADDDRLARQLEESAKDGAEHMLVADFVVDALKPFAETVTARPPEVVRFTNIQHLATAVSADLRLPAADALELAAALHPTPAVGGWPRAAADALIDELEAMERGWYAGAVGWIDAGGDGEFAVALRCGLLWEDGARLYAGVGVMPDSDAARELEETELKFKALLTALV